MEVNQVHLWLWSPSPNDQSNHSFAKTFNCLDLVAHLTSVITLDQLSSLFTLVRLETRLQGIERLTYTCLSNKWYLDGKVQGKMAFK